MAFTGPQGIQGNPGLGGTNGKDATINGLNVLEIVDGENTEVKVTDSKLQINAIIPSSSVDLMFFGLENGNPVTTHTAPASSQTILPTTYFPANPGVWHDIVTFTIASDLHGTELEFIPGNSFTAKFWITSDMARSNAQFRLSASDVRTGSQLATGTVSADLGATGVPSPVLITGIYELPAVVPAENVRMTLQILTPLFGVQLGLVSIPPNEISYIARLISGTVTPEPTKYPWCSGIMKDMSLGSYTWTDLIPDPDTVTGDTSLIVGGRFIVLEDGVWALTIGSGQLSVNGDINYYIHTGNTGETGTRQYYNKVNNTNRMPAGSVVLRLKKDTYLFATMSSSAAQTSIMTGGYVVPFTFVQLSKGALE